MSRTLLYGLFACTAAMLLFRQARSTRVVVPVDKAAELLRQAWQDNHTVV